MDNKKLQWIKKYVYKHNYNDLKIPNYNNYYY